jgi:hypothetical protein
MAIHDYLSGASDNNPYSNGKGIGARHYTLNTAGRPDGKLNDFLTVGTSRVNTAGYPKVAGISKNFKNRGISQIVNEKVQTTNNSVGGTNRSHTRGGLFSRVLSRGQ